MKNQKRKGVFIAVAFAVFLAAFFCPKMTRAFEDNDAPEVLSLVVSPTEINTSEADQTITVTIRVKDEGVGVCLPNDTGCESSNNGSTIWVRFTPLIGTSTQQLELNGNNFKRISGDDFDAIYELYGTLRRGSKQGIWELGDGGPLSFGVNDRLGNSRLYVNDLNYANTYGYEYLETVPGITRTFVNTATGTSVTIQRAWTMSSTNVAATFAAGTVVSKNDGGSFAIYQMVNQDFNISDVTTDGLDSTDTSNIVGKIKIGIPGLNLSFSKPVTLEFNVGSQYNGQTLEIQTLEENGGSWANETTCTVSSGKCSFTVNHASYFAAIKTTASSTANGTVSGSTDGNIVIGSDTPSLTYSTSKKAKKRMTLTFNGLSLTKRQWVKVRLNGRKVTTVRVRRSGNDSTVTISFKYGKWAVGNYNMAMSYKNQIKVPYTTKKGKTKYRKGWESGSVASENILSII